MSWSERCIGKQNSLRGCFPSFWGYSEMVTMETACVVFPASTKPNKSRRNKNKKTHWALLDQSWSGTKHYIRLIKVHFGTRLTLNKVLRHFIIVHKEIRISKIVKFHAMFSQPVVWTHFAIGYRSGHISLKVPKWWFFLC